MLYQLWSMNAKAQGPFIPQDFIAPTQTIQTKDFVTQTESDAVDISFYNRRVAVTVRDGEDPAFYYLATNTSNSTSNDGIINLPWDAEHCDIALAHDVNTSEYYAVVIYTKIATTGIFVEYYEYDISSNDFVGTPCSSDYIVTEDLVAHTINIDADYRGNFLISADVYIGGTTPQLSALVLIPGTLQEGTSVSCINSSYSPGINEECITYVRPKNDTDELTWPDISLSENFWYGGQIYFVDNVSAVITYMVGSAPNRTVEVIVAPDFPCFDYLKEEQLEGLTTLAGTTDYWLYEPWYRYYVLTDAPYSAAQISGTDMLHPRVSSNALNDVSWQVVCENYDAPRSDIFMFSYVNGFPDEFDYVNLTDPTGFGLISGTTISGFNCFFPQIALNNNDGYSNIIFDVEENSPGTEKYSIACRMDGISNSIQFSNSNAMVANDFTHFDEYKDNQFASSVGGRFSAEYSFYSAYDANNKEWQFRYPTTLSFRIGGNEVINSSALIGNEFIHLKSSNFISPIMVPRSSNGNYSIFDLQGKLILSGNLVTGNSSNELMRMSRSLSTGMYLLKFLDVTSSYSVQKIVKSINE